MGLPHEPHNLLVVSDLHLAEGLVGEAGECCHGLEAFLYDGAFARFLRYHQELRWSAALRLQAWADAPDEDKPQDEEAVLQDVQLARPWRLVLAGDAFDLWDIARVPGDVDELEDALTAYRPKLDGHHEAQKWICQQLELLDDGEEPRPPEETAGNAPKKNPSRDYGHIRQKLDQLDLQQGSQRRDLEELAWWTEVLLSKSDLKVTDREKRDGLGTTWQEVVWKLTRIYRGHREFFAALAWFIASGNELVLLKGNHDLELHWPQVHAEHFPFLLADAYRDLRGAQAEASESQGYLTGLLASLELTGLPNWEAFRALLPKRFAFEPWFYYEKDLVYVEHGNQYEPLDSSAFFLAPKLPSDQTTVELPWGGLMARALYNKIVAVHPFAVNVKPEHRLVHWMIANDFFRIVGILLAELPDVGLALWRALKQGFRGTWIRGDHSITGLIPLLAYDLIQIFEPKTWEGEQQIRAEAERSLEKLAEHISQGAPGVQGAPESAATPSAPIEGQAESSKKKLYARTLLHLGALGIALSLLGAGACGLTGCPRPGLFVPGLLVLSAVLALIAIIWSLRQAGQEGWQTLGQVLLQLGGVGLLAGLIANLCLAREMGWSWGARLLLLLVPLTLAIAGGWLIRRDKKSRPEADPWLPVTRRWPATVLRSSAAFLTELGLLGLVVGASYLFGSENMDRALRWLCCALLLFLCGWGARRWHSLYVHGRRRQQVAEGWLDKLDDGTRTVAFFVFGLLIVAVLLAVCAWLAHLVLDAVVQDGSPDVMRTIDDLANRVYGFVAGTKLAGTIPLLSVILLGLGVVVLLEIGLSAFWDWLRARRKPRQGQPDLPTDRSLIPNVKEQLEVIQELARAEQRRWASSMLGVFTIFLPVVSMILLVIALLGLATTIGALTEILESVKALVALSVTTVSALAYWVLRQISSALQRRDLKSGFGDLFYRMAASIAGILDGGTSEGAAGGFGCPRYIVFGHDHWADSKIISGAGGWPSRWYVNSGTWLRGYVEEQRSQEANENHSTFLQIIPGPAEHSAPRILRWNDGANQPEPIVRRDEPQSVSQLLWTRWEQRWLFVLSWFLVMAVLTVALPEEKMSGLWPVLWALALWLAVWGLSSPWVLIWALAMSALMVALPQQWLGDLWPMLWGFLLWIAVWGLNGSWSRFTAKPAPR